jgi:hypothetical protein
LGQGVGFQGIDREDPAARIGALPAFDVHRGRLGGREQGKGAAVVAELVGPVLEHELRALEAGDGQFIAAQDG